MKLMANKKHFYKVSGVESKFVLEWYDVIFN